MSEDNELNQNSPRSLLKWWIPKSVILFGKCVMWGYCFLLNSEI